MGALNLPQHCVARQTKSKMFDLVALDATG